jgi:hypothetical protein
MKWGLDSERARRQAIVIALLVPGCDAPTSGGADGSTTADPAVQDPPVVESRAPNVERGASLSASPVPAASDGCVLDCLGPDGPCRHTGPCCPPGQWFAAAPLDAGLVVGAQDLRGCAPGEQDLATPAYDANCHLDFEASPAEQCGVPHQGASICLGNAAGRAYWTSTCKVHGDCPLGMQCTIDGIVAGEVDIASPNFGRCQRTCVEDTDCLRCDLACVGGLCVPTP